LGAWSTGILKTADAVLGPAACAALSLIERLSGRDTVPEPLDPADVRRILVVRPGGLGDMIVLLPVLDVLRKKFPDATIRLVCEKRNIEVLRVAGMAELGIAYDTNPFRLLSHLVRTTYDLAIDTEQFHHFSAVFAFLSGARTRIGFKINPRRNPLYTHLVDYALDGREGDEFMKLTRPLGVDDEYEPAGILADARIELPMVFDAKLKNAFDDKPFAVIHPCGYTPQKRWPADAFACLVRDLHESHGMGTVLVGDKSDRPGAESIVEEAKPQQGDVLSLAGQLNLSGTAALIKKAGVFIGPDSGLAHLATALGTRTVVLFGPSDHRKWGTESLRHAVVRKDMPCAPCFIFGYHKPCRRRTCMTGISPADVLSKVGDVLAE